VPGDMDVDATAAEAGLCGRDWDEAPVRSRLLSPEESLSWSSSMSWPVRALLGAGCSLVGDANWRPSVCANRASATARSRRSAAEMACSSPAASGEAVGPNACEVLAAAAPESVALLRSRVGGVAVSAVLPRAMIADKVKVTEFVLPA